MNLNYKILLLLALCNCNAEFADPLGQFCNTYTNIGSQILANIDRLLPEMVSKTPSNGFIATSYGKSQYRVLAWLNVEGIKSFIGEIDTSYGMLYGNVENVTDPDTFNKELGTLIGQIRAQAVETKNEGLGKASRKRDNISNISQPSGKENHMIEPKTESRVLDCSMPAKI
nr:cysteine-rich repeat secretory protein 55 [Quercus suber]